jgi:y4mF family transcriptional regulator
MRIRSTHDLAAVVRGRRLDLGWTQAGVAQRIGVSRKWVSDFETGKTSVDLATVLRLLETLDVSPTPRPGSNPWLRPR